jgi:hypothetical protein
MNFLEIYRNRRTLVTTLMLWALLLPIKAQTISVVNFYLNDKDLTANSRATEVLDQNGDRCALIRVQTTTKGFVFDVGSAGVQKVDYDHTGEIWVWVPFGVRHISIRHPQLGSLPNYDFPIPIQKARSYIMEITSDKVFVNNYDDTRKQVLSIKITPPESLLSLNGLRIALNEQGETEQELSFGTYTYKVESEGYYPQEGQIIIDNPTDKQTLVINNLRPRLGKLSVHVLPIAATVTVDGKHIDYTSLTPLELQIGQHEVKVTADGYREENFAVNIQEGKTSDLQATLSQVSDFQITSTPAGAQVYLAEKNVGVTPCTLTLSTGTYRVKATLNRHKDYEKLLNFNSATPQINLPLKRIMNYRNEFYIEASTCFGSYIAYGAALGFFIHNVNLEGSYYFSRAKSEEIYWIGNSTKQLQAQYSPRIDFRGKIGYGLSIGSRFRITPQLGVKFLKLDEVQDSRADAIADGSNVVCGLGSVRCSFALSKEVKLSVTPEYNLPLYKSKGYERVSATSPTVDDWSKGISFKLGLAVFL